MPTDLPRVRIRRLAAAVAIRNRLRAMLEDRKWLTMPQDEFDLLIGALKLASRRVDSIMGVRS